MDKIVFFALISSEIYDKESFSYLMSDSVCLNILRNGYENLVFELKSTCDAFVFANVPLTFEENSDIPRLSLFEFCVFDVLVVLSNECNEYWQKIKKDYKIYIFIDQLNTFIDLQNIANKSSFSNITIVVELLWILT